MSQLGILQYRVDEKSPWQQVPALIGPKGEPGKNGISPTATVTQTSNGASISITDKNGTTTADIKNGEKGESGTPGRDGQDGKPGENGGYYTPVVTQPDPEHMNVHQEPSKPDMPTVEDVKIALPKGSGGGSEKPWRKIAEVTVSDPVTVIEFTKDENSQPLSITDFILYNTKDLITEDTGAMLVKVNSTVYNSNSLIIKSSPSVFVKTESFSDKRLIICGAEGYSGYYNGFGKSTSIRLRITDTNKIINSITLQMAYGKPFTSGNLILLGR